MSHVPHDIHAEFPEDSEILHRLKLGDGRFQAIFDRYHEVNRDIHRIEAGIEAASDDRLEELKKQRLAMLDEVSAMIGREKVA